jgi:DNA-binding Lrp family transcriptional regulator
MDSIDKKIISILQEDGRASLSSIARQLGMSHVAVKKRLDKLAIVYAEVETPKRLRELVDIFSKCPRMVFLTTTTGAYNLMTIMAAEDADTLNAIVQECSARAQMNIRRSEAIIGEAPAVPKYLPIKIIATKEDEVAPCGTNCGKCPRYEQRKCLACPATKYYRGPL